MQSTIRDKVGERIYASILKPVLFKYDPEKVHNVFLKVGKTLGLSGVTRTATQLLFSYKHPSLNQKIAGINFPNPIGLSAGFDKDAMLTDIIPKVGFGFIEVGSITAKPYEGNNGKRLKRLPEKNSLWVNYGLKNTGADKIYSHLKSKKFEIPLGISVAKTNCKETVETSAAIKDYVYTMKKFAKVGDYFTINISCPNAFGGTPFHNPALLDQLLKEYRKTKIKKPTFVKISPDLKKENIDKIIALARKYKLTGFVCANLTKQGIKEKTGGYSGKVVEKASNELIRYVYKKTRGEFVIVGAGGVFSSEDAYKKIKLGASLIQLITGMIYRGPSAISDINHGLVKLLEKDSYKNISEAIGADAK